MDATTAQSSTATANGAEIASRGGLVVGIDGSPASQLALDWALRAAAGRGCGVRAVAAFDWPEYVGVGLDISDAQLRELTVSSARKQVDKALARWREGGELDPPLVTADAIPGPAGSVLLGAARGGHGLVIGHRPRGVLRSVVLGSVGLSCVLHASVPVTVVRPQALEAGAGQPGDAARNAVIVVGVDGSPGSLDALRYALAEAARRAGRVMVIAAGPTPRPTVGMTPFPLPESTRAEIVDSVQARVRAFVEHVMADYQRDAGQAPPWQLQTVLAPAADALLEAVTTHGAEHLVVGHRGRGAVASHVIGSVGLSCVLHAPGTVTVVPPTGSDAPDSDPARAAQAEPGGGPLSVGPIA